MAEHDMFSNNSNKAKSGEPEPKKAPERAHAKPVARLVNEQQKPGFGKKFKKLFLADDVDDIGGYLRDDLIIPTLKDVALNFLEAALWGTRRSGGIGRSSSRGSTRSGYTNYSQSSSVARVSRGSTRNREEESQASAKKFDILDNLLFRTKPEAEDILARMEDYLDSYDQVPVGYLYELLDISGDWTAEYYGWKDLRRARTTRVSNGYVLELPNPIELSRR